MPPKRKRPHGDDDDDDDDDDELAAASPPGRLVSTRRTTRQIATAPPPPVSPVPPVRRTKKGRGWGGRRTKGMTVAEQDRLDAERAARAKLEQLGMLEVDEDGNKSVHAARTKPRQQRTTARAAGPAWTAQHDTVTRRTLRDGKALPEGRPQRRASDATGGNNDDDDDGTTAPAQNQAHTATTAVPLPTGTAGVPPAALPVLPDPRLLAAAATPEHPAQKPPRPPHPPHPPRQPRRGGAAASAVPATVSASSAAPPPPASPGRPDRNIDKVVLGGICFRAWYPSYYGKEVLGDTTGGHAHHPHPHHHQYHPGRGGGRGGSRGGIGHGHGHGRGGSQRQQQGRGKAGADGVHRDGGSSSGSTPMLDRLYVCPYCFKYSKEIVPWYGHVQLCERQFQIPGEKVYVHPKGVRTERVPVPDGAAGSGRRRKANVPNGGNGGNGGGDGGDNGGDGSDSSAYVEQVVRDEGEWSVWEVDGEADVLFCQNLSLFAKLFLDNKSVFFDVTGFDYFLLVYTPPPPPPPPLPPLPLSLPLSLSPGQPLPPSPTSSLPRGVPPPVGSAAVRPQVVGFFSKEKMSWDNNNLACILVFPPWQRKGLGALLMGVSYEIARREGVLGGPEKPISDLGKRGYKRFWAGEIARWLLGVDVEAAAATTAVLPGDGREVFTANNNPPSPPPSSSPAVAPADEPPSIVIDVADCSRATWIVRDDCLSVLREMGVVEDAGMGLPKKACSNVLPLPPPPPPVAVAADGPPAVRGQSPLVESSSSPSLSLSSPSSPAAAGPAPAAAPPPPPPADTPKAVQRVRISKAAVRQWIQAHHIRLDKACDPAGFLKVYARKDGQQADE